MSEENVEIARRGYEAFNKGDPDGMVANFAPNFEYVTTGGIPGVDAVYRGPEGLTEFVGWMWGEFEEPRIEVHELTEAGNQVLAEVTLRGRGQAEWRRDQLEHLAPLDRAGRQDRARAGIHVQARGPRSCRAAGVGQGSTGLAKPSESVRPAHELGGNRKEIPMAIAVEVSFHGADATMDKYFESIKLMGTGPEGVHPGPGCLFHWITSDAGGPRVTDVWRTREEFDKFAQEQIGPKSEQAGMPKPQTKFIEVDNFLTAGS
jgi:ketosteroid isomerase-like protein